MRDNLDISYLIKEPDFGKLELFKGFSDQMLKIARLKYKLSNEQARRIYEILRCYWCQNNSREYEKFVQDVKKHRKAQFIVSFKEKHY